MASDIEIKRAVENEVLPFVRVTGKKLVSGLTVLLRSVNELRDRVSALEQEREAAKEATMVEKKKKGGKE